MWRYDKTTITEESLLKALKDAAKGSITVLDGPSGCGKTRLLKELERAGMRSVEIYSVEVFKDFIMEKIYSSPHRKRDLAGNDIIAIEDIDFLRATKYNGPHVKTSNEDLMVNVWSKFSPDSRGQETNAGLKT